MQQPPVRTQLQLVHDVLTSAVSGRLEQSRLAAHLKRNKLANVCSKSKLKVLGSRVEIHDVHSATDASAVRVQLLAVRGLPSREGSLVRRGGAEKRPAPHAPCRCRLGRSRAARSAPYTVGNTRLAAQPTETVRRDATSATSLCAGQRRAYDATNCRRRNRAVTAQVVPLRNDTASGRRVFFDAPDRAWTWSDSRIGSFA